MTKNEFSSRSLKLVSCFQPHPCPKLLKLILVAIGVVMPTYLKIVVNLHQYHDYLMYEEEKMAMDQMSSMIAAGNITKTGNISIQNPSSNATIRSPFTAKNGTLKFFIIHVPEATTDLVTDSSKASSYYRKALNEESAEIWLHRGFERLPQRTLDPRKADVFVVAGYLHLFQSLRAPKKRKTNFISQEWQQLIPLYESQIFDPTKAHILLIPTWNPQVSRSIGVHGMVKMLKNAKVADLWSVGFERNPKWQHLPPSRIVPIPYVVSLDDDEEAEEERSVVNNTSTILRETSQSRIDHSLFYVGDARKNAQAWAGCYREELVSSIQQQQRQLPTIQPPRYNDTFSGDLWNVQLLGKRDRMEQSVYNMLMKSSDWCLVLCGDTPTSRTLTSSMVFGCLPLRVGSRLRGLCEEPCHPGFGWTVTGKASPHLPFVETIDWKAFPEINEGQLLNSSQQDNFLMRLLQRYDAAEKKRLRGILQQVRRGWIYGWGDPVTSTRFGDASKFIWDSWVVASQKV
ncbi:exostosin family protein [Nitzschia inconspicua]|uniref:Exostosin family protein n=1 Tax=Nitzschia inconspicua TaxID=303405 RepID=A0A9K3LQY7_9STRA|nr:exostosin family protein [Nitzschia inconspicua]